MKIPAKNHLLSGIIAGILVMAIAYGFFKLILLIPFFHDYATNPRLPFLFAAIPNLLLMRFWLAGKRLEQAGKGVLLVTFVAIIAVFIIFGT
jgi:hypothetical protein